MTRKFAVFFHVFVENSDGSYTPQKMAADGLVRIVEDKDLHGVGYWKRWHRDQ